MRKLYVVGLALVAALALSGVASSSAFAESEFLVGGAPAVSGQEVHTEGEVELVDLTTLLGETIVLCSGLFTGQFLAANDAFIEKAFDLTGVEAKELPGTAIACTNDKNCPTPLVNVDNIAGGWLAQVELINNEFWVDLTAPAGNPGWDVTCMGILGEPAVLCEGLALGLAINNPAEKDFNIEFTLAEQEAQKVGGTCFEGTTERKEVAYLVGKTLALPVIVEGIELESSVS